MTTGELRDLLEPMRRALERIADALERFEPDQPEPETMPTTCPHPEESRASFGMTDGQEDWLCRLCGYRTVP